MLRFHDKRLNCSGYTNNLICEIRQKPFYYDVSLLIPIISTVDMGDYDRYMCKDRCQPAERTPEVTVSMEDDDVIPSHHHREADDGGRVVVAEHP